MPLQIEQVRRHRHAALIGRGGRQVLELDIQHAHAVRHLQLERIHVAGIARPLQCLTIAANDQPGHLVDRPGRCVVAGNPLRIPQRQWARCDRNALAHALDAAGDVAGVHLQFDHARIAGLHLHRGLSCVALLRLYQPRGHAQCHRQQPVPSVLHHAPPSESLCILARIHPRMRCQISRRLLAGIVTSSRSVSPCARASASTASKSRMPERGSRAFSQPSKCWLLSLVKVPL
ncbi:hypothetical protein D3C71_1170220 [compost metagenome]